MKDDYDKLMEADQMNQFEAIQRQVESQVEKQPVVENVMQPSKAVHELATKRKERKEDFVFTLYPSDREKLNELALQTGHVTAKGRPNASAFLTALIKQL